MCINLGILPRILIFVCNFMAAFVFRYFPTEIPRGIGLSLLHLLHKYHLPITHQELHLYTVSLLAKLKVVQSQHISFSLVAYSHLQVYF